ncbi:MAG TPA: hypothetical protein VKT32_04560, partial [Chthonomonadaceae bacterium]|nr:hypothetical protein [Chthonomonadaceae bacterium]
MSHSESEPQALSQRHAHISRRQTWKAWLCAWGPALLFAAFILFLVLVLGALSVLRLYSIPASAPTDLAHA